MYVKLYASKLGNLSKSMTFQKEVDFWSVQEMVNSSGRWTVGQRSTPKLALGLDNLDGFIVEF